MIQYFIVYDTRHYGWQLEESTETDTNKLVEDENNCDIFPCCAVLEENTTGKYYFNFHPESIVPYQLNIITFDKEPSLECESLCFTIKPI